MSDEALRPRPALATALSVALLVAGVVIALLDPGTVWDELLLILGALAAGSELIGSRYAARLTISASFIAGMLAVGFLGPAAAFIVPTVGHVAAWVAERYRWRALVMNIGC